MEARAASLASVRGCAAARGQHAPSIASVWYAGWADKLAQVLGSSNPVAGPYFNFTLPEPTGVVAVIAPDEPALDGLVGRVVPALVGGNAVVVVASEAHPLAAIELAEAIATSDVPRGVVNVLTGLRDELAPVLAAHMDVNAIDVTGADGAGRCARGARRGERQEGRAGARGTQPLGDRRVHGAEDGLAPHRSLSRPFRRSSRRSGHPNPPPAANSIDLVVAFGDERVSRSCRVRDGVHSAPPRSGSLAVAASTASTASAAVSRRRSSDPSASTHGLPASGRTCEVPLVHGAPLLVEFADPVVAPRHIEPADDEEVVPPLHELCERGRRTAEVHLVEDGRRERVGVPEEDDAREPGEEVLVPAVDARDVRELVARPGRLAPPADLRVGTAVLRVPHRPVAARERSGEGRLARRLCSEEDDAPDVRHVGRAYGIARSRSRRAGGRDGCIVSASGPVTARRLSQAIAEGDGISVLVEVRDAHAAELAEGRGAEGLVVRGVDVGLRGQTALPLLAYGPTPDERLADAADAVVLTADDDHALGQQAERCRELGVEYVVRVRDDDELERVLEQVDPEILLLTAELAEDEQEPLDRLLELLPDVPAGKLAIAELADASRSDVEALERAGVDAVLVTGDVAALVGDAVPDV